MFVNKYCLFVFCVLNCDFALCPSKAKLARQNQGGAAASSKDAAPTLVDRAAGATGSYSEALLAQNRERAAQEDERRIQLCGYMWDKLRGRETSDGTPLPEIRHTLPSI